MDVLKDESAETVVTDFQFEKSKRTAFAKFTTLQWNKVEKVYESTHMKNVLAAICNLGSDDKSVQTQTSTNQTYGDEIYLDIVRPSLVKLNFVPKQLPSAYKKPVVKVQTVKNKKKKGISKDDIIKENTLRRVQKALVEILPSFDMKKLNTGYGFSSSYAEMKIMTLIYLINYLINQEDRNELECYEVIIGAAKTLKNTSNNMPTLSTVVQMDLLGTVTKLRTTIGFNFETMFNRYPRLCLSTKYDTLFPSMTIRPYESQVQLMNNLRNTPEAIFLYNAMIGSGKTTFSLAICKFVEKLRAIAKAKSETPNLQVIFSCSVEPVRHEVCRMAYNEGIAFGIGVLDRERSNVRVINNYNCSKDEDRILIVADLDATVGLLSGSQDYILFLDEPTVGADEEDNPVTKAVCRILMLSPSRTILSSATLPPEYEIQELVNHFRERHVESKVLTVRSKESMIGCEIITYDGLTILPHNGCKTVDELARILELIKDKPFIDRLYTAPVVYKIRNRMIENNVKNVLNIEKEFENIEVLCQTEIQKVAVKLIEQLINAKSDKIVEKVCEPFGKIELETAPSEVTNSDSEDDMGNGFAWAKEDDSEISVSNTYDISKIFTTEAYKYLGSCLVAVDNPLKFAYETSRELLEGHDQAYKVIAKYKSVKDKYEDALKRLENIKNEDERSKKVQELTDGSPILEFPDALRVNTIHHLNNFAKHYTDKVDMKTLQGVYPLETISFDLQIPDWVMTLLFAGIGIYSPQQGTLSQEYTELVLSMASNRQLAFLISDDNICYGANYPFAHVIITDDIATTHSIGTLFQLAGRAGRVGQSWVAYAHVSDLTGKRIMNYIHGNEGTGATMEAVNMIKSFKSIINAKKKSEEDKNNIVQLNKVRETMENLNDFIFIPNKKVPPPIKTIQEEQLTVPESQSTVYVPPHLRKRLDDDNQDNRDNQSNENQNRYSGRNEWTTVNNKYKQRQYK